MFALSDQRHRRILVFDTLDPDVAGLALAPPAALGGIGAPLGLCIGAGHLLVADHARDLVWAVELSGSTWHTIGAATVDRPRAVAVSADGAVFVTDRHRLWRFDDVAGTNPTELIPPVAGVATLAVAVDTTTLYATTSDGRLRRSVDGGISWADSDLGGIRPAAPFGLFVAEDGTAIVCDAANRRVLAVDPAGTVTELLAATSAADDSLALPVAAVLAAGDVVVADAAWNRLRRYAMTGGPPVAAEYLNGRRHDGTYRFDRIGGLTYGELG